MQYSPPARINISPAVHNPPPPPPTRRGEEETTVYRGLCARPRTPARARCHAQGRRSEKRTRRRVRSPVLWDPSSMRLPGGCETAADHAPPLSSSRSQRGLLVGRHRRERPGRRQRGEARVCALAPRPRQHLLRSCVHTHSESTRVTGCSVPHARRDTSHKSVPSAS